jgi:long-subunit acyl-CoA synthetase (AMP-forming)
MSTQTVERTATADTRAAGTLCAAFTQAVANHPDRVALRTMGDEVVVTYAEYAQRVRRTAAGLAALGVRRGDRVALMLTNRPEFFWVDVAIMHLGAVAFGIYTPFAADQIAHVLRATGARVAVTERVFGARLLAACADAPGSSTCYPSTAAPVRSASGRWRRPATPGSTSTPRPGRSGPPTS